MCDKQDLIVDYVYDELSAGDRTALEQHLGGCAVCRVELEELRATRRHLALWSPPEPELGFRVIRGGSVPAQALPRRARFAPAFGFAAAAAIVLAAALAIANVEIRYGTEGMTIRTGWAERPDGAGAAAVRPDVGLATGATPAEVTSPGSAEFAALEQRLREIEAALSSGAGASPGVQMASSGERMSDAEMLRRVRQIVGDAEARQETAVAQLLLQVMRDVDQQRRADLALIQQGLGQYQGLTNAEIAQNREMVNQLVRAATTTTKQEK